MDHFSPSYFALLEPLDRARLAEQVIPESALEFLSALSAAGVRYLLCGDLALTLHRVPGRSTDVELLMDPEEDNIRLFTETAGTQQLDAGGEIVFDEFRDKKGVFMSSLRLSMGSGPPALVLLNTSLPYEECFHRRSSIHLESLVIHLLSLEDLMMVRELMEK